MNEVKRDLETWEEVILDFLNKSTEHQSGLKCKAV